MSTPERRQRHHAGHIAAVVLAAGEAARFGAPKQRLLLPDVLAALEQSEAVGEVVVVEGAHPLESGPAVRLVRCPGWARGPGASLRCGLAALPEDADAWQIADALSDEAPITAAPETPLRNRVIAVWGPHGAPGRSTVAIQLAVEVTRSGQTCALIDADTVAPSLALLLGLSASDHLHRRQGAEAVIRVRLTCPFMYLPRLVSNTI